MDFHIVIREHPCWATVLLDAEVYKMEAVTAAAYGQAGTYGMQINAKGQEIEVTFIPKDQLDPDRLRRDMLEFMNDTLDEQLRLQLDHKTGRIREIIVEHAFKPFEKLREKISENS